MASRNASGVEKELGHGHGHPFMGEEGTQVHWWKTSGRFLRVFGSSVPWAGQRVPLQTSHPADAGVVMPSETDQMMLPCLSPNLGEVPSAPGGAGGCAMQPAL